MVKQRDSRNYEKMKVLICFNTVSVNDLKFMCVCGGVSLVRKLSEQVYWGLPWSEVIPWGRHHIDRLEFISCGRSWNWWKCSGQSVRQKFLSPDVDPCSPVFPSIYSVHCFRNQGQCFLTTNPGTPKWFSHFNWTTKNNFIM